MGEKMYNIMQTVLYDVYNIKVNLNFNVFHGGK